MPLESDSTLLAGFLRGNLSNDDFHHADHVRVAWEMLTRHSFVESARLYANGLRGLCARAGRPDAYHETITIAFLSLIGERVSLDAHDDFDAFAASNADLLEQSCLTRWYTSERLQSAVARRTFVLPTPGRSGGRA